MVFEVSKDALAMSRVLSLGNMLEGLDVIELPSVVHGPEIESVWKYCEFHCCHDKSAEGGVTDAETKKFDNEFVKMERGRLFAVILAANYLDIKPLLDLCCTAVKVSLSGNSPDKIRREYNIINDLTPEDEEELRTESEWLYQ